MIRAVIDTNILVSALRTRTGNEAGVVQAVREGRIHPCMSIDMAQEYASVLSRSKFGFDQSAVKNLLDSLHRLAMLIDANQDSPASPDPSDTKFIACAIAGDAHFLVTGNRRHFPESRYGTAAVVNARELLAQLG